MGNVFDDMLERSRRGEPRTEDWTGLYRQMPNYFPLFDIVGSGEYKGMRYEIQTNWNYPRVEIHCDSSDVLIYSSPFLSVIPPSSKKRNCRLGRDILKYFSDGRFRVLYDDHGDYTSDHEYGEDGRKFSVSDLEEDAKVYIDLIIESSVKQKIRCDRDGGEKKSAEKKCKKIW